MVRSALRHVRWVGGASGAGKSTIARILASEYGLRVYSTDEAISRHSTRAGPDAPLLTRFLEMSMDERWLHRDPEAMLETFPWFAGERFDNVVDDLRQANDTPTLAEGFRLRPPLVARVLDEPWHAVWLVPTDSFRRAAFERRPVNQQFWRRTSDPSTALELLLRRDALFAQRICREAEALAMKLLHVDGKRTAADLAADVGDWFRLKGQAGSRT